MLVTFFCYFYAVCPILQEVSGGVARIIGTESCSVLGNLQQVYLPSASIHGDMSLHSELQANKDFVHYFRNFIDICEVLSILTQCSDSNC